MFWGTDNTGGISYVTRNIRKFSLGCKCQKIASSLQPQGFYGAVSLHTGSV